MLQAVRSALSLCALVFLVFLTWVQATPDPYDVAVNDGGILNTDTGPLAAYNWKNLNQYAQPGFCLSVVEGRVITNLSAPLYSRPITLTYAASYGAPTVYQWVAKLLIQERLGYNVMAFDDIGVLTSGGTYSRTLILQPASRRVDAYVYTDVLETNPAPEFLLVDGKNILNRGSHRVQDRQGIYIPRHTIQNNPGIGVDHWRTYTVGSNARNEQPPPLAAQQALRDVFIADTWDGLVKTSTGTITNWLLNDPADPTSGPVCVPTMVGAGGTIRTGCGADPNFPSMYIPLQCYPDPRSQCAVLYMISPVLDPGFNGYLQPMVTHLNMSIAVAFVNIGLLAQAEFTFQFGFYANKNYITWLESSLPNPYLQCMDASTGTSQACWHRVDLPLYDSGCDALYTGQYDSIYSCDFPFLSVVKIGSETFAEEAPRADYLIQQLSFGPEDNVDIYAGIIGMGYEPPYKKVACDWIKSNKARWSSWIAPPPACQASDFHADFGACNAQTATIHVTYSWFQPKPCVAGVDLPPAESVSCGYLTSSQWKTRAFLAVASLLFALVFVLITVKVAASWAARSLMVTVTTGAGKTPFDPTQEKGALTAATAAAAASSTKAAFNAANATVVVPTGQSKTIGEKLLAAERNLPIILLAGDAIHPFFTGILSFLLYPLIALNELSSSQCWIRFSVLLFGIVLCGQAGTLTLQKLRANINRTLEQRNQQRMALAMLAATVVSAIVIIVAANISSGDLVHFRIHQLQGNDSVNIPACSPPPLWMLVIVLFVHLPWILLGLSLSVRLPVRVHLTNILGTDTYAAIARSRAAQRAGRITRPQLVQVNSLSPMQLCWVAITVTAVTFLLVPSHYRYNEFAVFELDIVVLVGVPVLLVTFLGPSCWHRIKAVRNQNKVGGSNDAYGMSKNSRNSKNESQTNNNNGEDIGSLASLLTDPVSLLHFRRFAERHFDAEAIHFLLACQDLLMRLKSPTLTLAQLLADISLLMNEYVQDGAPQQVNVSSAQRGAALMAFEEMRLNAVTMAGSKLKPAPANVKADARASLHELVQEVYALVQVNAVPRFQLSPAVGRCTHLQTWADGFDELDMEEMSAMLIKFRAKMSIAKRYNDESQLGSRNISEADMFGDAPDKKELKDNQKEQEAEILMFQAESKPDTPIRAPTQRVVTLHVHQGGTVSASGTRPSHAASTFRTPIRVGMYSTHNQPQGSSSMGALAGHNRAMSSGGESPVDSRLPQPLIGHKDQHRLDSSRDTIGPDLAHL